MMFETTEDTLFTNHKKKLCQFDILKGKKVTYPCSWTCIVLNLMITCFQRYREKTPYIHFVKPQVFSHIGPGKFFMHTTHLLHLWWKQMPT